VLASQVLGEGTSGTVVLGVERATSRHVAVKILRKQARPGRSAARHVLKKIADEVELLEQLQGCPRVVRLVGKFEDDESAYVVTELCSEGDLGYFTESFEFSEVDAAFMARDLLAVLAECHARNIAHCDIKPENFMVSTAPCGMRSLKAVDFGCGQVVRDGYPLREKTGTPIYRAPEMYQRMYGLEADLWAAGMIIYALLCGRLCFWDCLEECTPESVMDSILNAEVSYEHDIWASVSPAAADLVRSLLQRDPALRISAREALENEWIVSNCGPTSLSFVESEDDDRSIESPSFVNNVVPTPAGTLSKKVNK
jgi:calcium-dependent protein kinase